MRAFFTLASVSGILPLPRESDGDGIGVPNYKAVSRHRSYRKRLFCWLIAKGMNPIHTLASLLYGRTCRLLREAGSL